jgi:hypothetical protein
MKNEMLPNELLWDKDEDASAPGQGIPRDVHASDVALAAVADGEVALVPPALMAHVEACAVCTHRLGESALFSAGLGNTIQAMGPLTRLAPVQVPVIAVSPASPASARRRAPLPLPMMAAAIVIAVLGAAPTILQLPTRISGLLLALLHSLPTVSHGGAQLLRSGLGPAGLVLTFVSALLLLMVSVGLTRFLPRPLVTQARR